MPYIRAPRALRAAVLAHYGGQCGWCGSTDHLELDHINNDGARHRQQLSQAQLSLEEWLVQARYPAGIVRVICRPCHELKTFGRVQPTTAHRRLVYFLQRSAGPMPPRKGSHAAHFTLSPEVIAYLDSLAAQTPDGNKSQIVQGILLRHQAGETNGHFADILASVEQRLTVVPDRVATDLAAIVAQATAATAIINNHAHKMETMLHRLDAIEGLLKQAFPTEHELKAQGLSRPRGWRALWRFCAQVWRHGYGSAVAPSGPWVRRE